MDNETAAVGYDHAPDHYRLLWKQQALGETLDEWHESRHNDFETIVYNRHSPLLIDIKTRPNATGQYGYDTNFELSLEIDQEIVDQITVDDSFLDLIAEFATDAQERMVELITTTQEASQFSAKEFAAVMLYQKEMVNEHRAADALGVTTGTYWGKVGRIKDKIEAAKLTARLCSDIGLKTTDDTDRNYTTGNADLVELFEADSYPTETELSGRIQSIIPITVGEVEQYTDTPTTDDLIKHLVEKYEHESVSTLRIRYEVERAIDKGSIERDGEIVRRAE